MTIQLPGSVTADAYREVRVVPIVSGIITRVHVELGNAVKRGASLATVFSVELAEAQTKYLSMRPILKPITKGFSAPDNWWRLVRRAVRKWKRSRPCMPAMRQRLRRRASGCYLLGLSRAHVEGLNSPRQVVSEVVGRPPYVGILTGRSANPGQVVGMGQELFVVTNLSEVWPLVTCMTGLPGGP